MPERIEDDKGQIGYDEGKIKVSNEGVEQKENVVVTTKRNNKKKK